MLIPYRFNRQEFAGSLGDLGVALPLGIAMILVNGLNPLGLLLGTREGLFGLSVGFNLPEILPFGFPSGADF